MLKKAIRRRSSPLARVLGAGMLALGLLAGCIPPAESKPKPPPCPPPPEPERQSVVVGTIGKLHLVESRYPLSKLAEVMAVFKPDLVLLAVRVDPFRENHLEDASFEMTYVHWLARARGAAVEPIDWFRLEDLGAPEAPVVPADERSIEQRETEVLHAPKQWTFEQASTDDLAGKIFFARLSAARHRSGDPLTSQRRAWVQHLAVDAVQRHGRPKRVMAYVDLFDRPDVDMVLGGIGYTPATPQAVLTKSRESLAGGDVPSDVLSAWRAEGERARESAAKAPRPAEAQHWSERARVLDVAVEKKGGCCVTQSALAVPARERSPGNP